MIQVYKNIYVGGSKVVKLLKKDEWSFVGVSSKYHYELMGWVKGYKYQNDPSYIVYQNNNCMSVNWIDASAKFYDWNGQGVSTFIKILDYIEKELKKNKKIYIFCDQGISRSPSVALLYLAKRLNKISNESFELARRDFLLLYPMYNPNGIKDFIKENWEKIK